MNLYFPGRFEDPRVKEYYHKLRERIIRVCDGIISEKEWDTTEIDQYLTTFIRPVNFYGAESVEVKHDKTFSELCYILTKDTGKDGRYMSVLEFYQVLQMIKKRHGRKPNKDKRPV